MKSTSVVNLFLAISLAGCQRGEADRAHAQDQPPRPAAAPAVVVPAEITPEYRADIEKLCDVVRLSGAGDDDAQTLTTANWLAANLTTQESRKFLISTQPMVGAVKADALDAEAKRVGLDGCVLSALWRKPNAVPPS
jgi:hypothetical protein